MKKRGKLNKNAVVGTIMTNLGFIKFCEENDIRFVATKVGDRFVLEEMLLEEYDFGGEQSGHVIFRDFATTGDGQLTSVQLLSLLRREGGKLSEFSRVMKRYPQAMINVRVSQQGKLRFYTDPAIKEAVEAGKKALGKDGRIVVRVSGTEPLIRVMTECADEALMQRIAQDTAKVIQDQLGGT
jgi:phosphoglucosamine mutase